MYKGSDSCKVPFPAKSRCKGPEGCTFIKLQSTVCNFHNIHSLYICNGCDHYHVCEGGDECIVINTGENIVCLLTGNCVSDDIEQITTIMAKTHQGLEKTYDECTYHGIAEAIKKDIKVFFNRENNGFEEIKKSILENGELKHDVDKLIDVTLNVSIHLFRKHEYGYDLICSMYIQIIISIYSTKTVYNSLLFKCTRNKRYDSVLKKMRELWMSTLVTGDIVVQNAAF
ncbi:protein UL92 [Vespertilionid gammaherpesvirus 1]|uniref:Protein UL92 n=1 Tax=Vespertilionid gammaherpesvirus 1 TaxID=2560830 RepID=A0A0X9XZT0_9GAMA|nr:protein UL92 [Myotis gammaherpesvirus 8]AMA67386.1 protein UL92 [Vespertilionid gammaherpesvirus 1]